MDELDILQDFTSEAQEAMMAEIRRKAALARTVPAPTTRECEDCGCDIPSARLMATPTARFCVECQGEIERERRRR